MQEFIEFKQKVIGKQLEKAEGNLDKEIDIVRNFSINLNTPKNKDREAPKGITHIIKQAEVL